MREEITFISPDFTYFECHTGRQSQTPVRIQCSVNRYKVSTTQVQGCSNQSTHFSDHTEHQIVGLSRKTYCLPKICASCSIIHIMYLLRTAENAVCSMSAIASTLDYYPRLPCFSQVSALISEHIRLCTLILGIGPDGFPATEMPTFSKLKSQSRITAYTS